MLYVPRHWWHYVESLDPITVSVNSWIDLVSNPIMSLPRTELLSSKSEIMKRCSTIWRQNSLLKSSLHQRVLLLRLVLAAFRWRLPFSFEYWISLTNVIVISVCAQWGVCAAWKAPLCHKKFLSSFSLRGHRHDTLCPQTVPLSFSVIILMCGTHSCFAWISVQEVDDVARVGEAVTKAVVFALKSAPSDDNKDNWLNPTEVANSYCDINYSLKSIATWLLPLACIGAAMHKKIKNTL